MLVCVWTCAAVGDLGFPRGACASTASAVLGMQHLREQGVAGQVSEQVPLVQVLLNL